MTSQLKSSPTIFAIATLTNSQAGPTPLVGNFSNTGEDSTLPGCREFRRLTLSFDDPHLLNPVCVLPKRGIDWRPGMDVCLNACNRTTCSSQEDADLQGRIRAEYVEMPGLKLTLPQAARLFNLEQGRCERVLGALVDDGALSNDGKAFVRAGPLSSREG